MTKSSSWLARVYDSGSRNHASDRDDKGRMPTPEERELAAKKTDLVALESQLAQRELDLATLQIELRTFQQHYLRTVGVKFAALDEAEAQIAETLTRQNPSDKTARQRAVEARSKAAESAGATGALEDQTRIVDFTPSDALRRLYREIAKCVHPDLASDEAQRDKRTHVMAEVNRAYATGDEQRLRAILNEWRTNADSVTGEGVGAELVRTIRKVHQVHARLAAVETEIAALTASELAVLKAKADAERMHGRD